MGAPFVTTQKLRFCDTDALGHVNNAVYAQLYEVGRAELMQHAGLLNQDGIGVVIVRLEIDFVRELVWPGEIRIETALVRFGTKSVGVRQSLVQTEGAVASRSASVLAVIDASARRAVPLTEAWRARLAPWFAPEFGAEGRAS